MPQSLLLKTIADLLSAELEGDGECKVCGINTLQHAGANEISFLANPRYKTLLATTNAAAVILSRQDSLDYSGNALIVDNPYLAYARVTEHFATDLNKVAGIHPSADIANTATIAPTASIGAHVHIGENVVIAEQVVIGAGVCIGNNCTIGSGTRLHANVTLYHDVSIGEQSLLHSGAVIGADGFGFARDGKQWVKIHQLGGVRIGNQVEIGACTTIDRGALGDTEIADGVILDNHVQIAHNVKIGANTAMAAFTGISGSTDIAENCTFAGKAGVVGHIRICAGVHVSAGTIITKSISQPGSYSSGTAMSDTKQWRKNAVRFNQLDDLATRITALEKKINQT